MDNTTIWNGHTVYGDAKEIDAVIAADGLISFLTEQANFLVFFFEKNYHFVGMGFLSHGTLPVTN